MNLMRYIIPPLNTESLFRIIFLALGTYLIFGYIFIPVSIEGKSMEPNFHDGSFSFCFGPEYLFAAPQRGDVVVIRFAGRHIMLLKRVVALEGDTVGFYEGVLHVNGRPVIEPYVKFKGKWNLATRKVEKGNIYVVGDNRDMPISKHKFGQTSKKRIIGGVVF